MVIWSQLERIRARENAKRGYLEVRTPIIYDADTFWTSGHFPSYEDLMF
jgi:threonyl-tRNA synthetase